MTSKRQQKIRCDVENKQTFIFKRNTYGPGSYSSQEHMYVCDADSSWMPIMLQFAAFLEGAGYVGVVERLDELMWE